jgi:hypothetical protein
MASRPLSWAPTQNECWGRGWQAICYLQVHGHKIVIYKGTPETTHFLNVDLDIYSMSNLQPLVSALGKKVFELHVGRYKRTYCAHLELNRITINADSTIRAFCALIGSLPRAERELWNTAKFRDFNIGVQAAAQPHSHQITLAAETVKAASESVLESSLQSMRRSNTERARRTLNQSYILRVVCEKPPPPVQELSKFTIHCNRLILSALRVPAQSVNSRKT